MRAIKVGMEGRREEIKRTGGWKVETRGMVIGRKGLVMDDK